MRSLSIVILGLLCLFDIVIAAPYSNVLRSNNGGDPDIEYHDGWYYMMSTNYANLVQRRSRTLNGLKTAEERLLHSPSNDPERARCQIWAPEQHLIDGIWYIYYAAGPCTNWTVNDQRTYVLRGGPSLWDPFTFVGPVNTPFFAIDSTLVYINSRRYFVYSCMRTDTGPQIASICIAAMSDPVTIGEERLISSPTEAWDCVGNCVDEGPHALYRDGRVFVTIAGGACGVPEYALGMLTWNGGDPLLQASWDKSDGPVFQGTANVTSTGHNSFFKSPDGSEDWMVYHSTSNPQGSCGNDRMINAKKVEFDSQGFPVFGTPPDYGVVLPGPSGETA